jgi:hypothetical protein
MRSINLSTYVFLYPFLYWQILGKFKNISYYANLKLLMATLIVAGFTLNKAANNGFAIISFYN